MPNFGGVELAAHSKVVKKSPSFLERALVARTVRKTAMAAMITRSRIPDPRERPRKIRSPAREVFRGGGGPGGVAEVISMGFSGLRGGWRRAFPGCSARSGRVGASAPWCGGAPDGAGGARGRVRPGGRFVPTRSALRNACPQTRSGQEREATASRTFLAISVGSGA
ncbi:hypothetical protein GCM10010214_40200 [Streptomyces abikoensis]|nr:hypothetical protein GCM10010214_40200 [Streptomyces abikoensis]